jgi:hypothetical protein
MFKCNSSDCQSNAQKCIDKFVVQSKFREMYPDKAKAIQGMTVPSAYCNSIEDMVIFADKKIKNQKVKLDEEKKIREHIGAPAKFDKYGKYKY